MALSKLLLTPLGAQQFFQMCLAVFLLLVYLRLMFQPPPWQETVCPYTYLSSTPGHPLGLQDLSVSINCSALVADDMREITKANEYRRCKPHRLTEDWYISATQNCDNFKHIRDYNSYVVTTEEEQFPIAFSILTYEHIEQTERLLRAIYRPHNMYCIHADLNSDRKFRLAIEAISGCLENVFMVNNAVRMRWAEFPVLEAELLCMNELLAKHPRWRYFINLTGREFPIRTNHELVRILKAYDGANDIDGSAHGRPMHWTKYSWRSEGWQSSNEKPPPPGDFLICKGSTHITASRAFVNYVINNGSAHALKDWMRDIRAPDEHFFQSLNHNPHKGVPGAFKGDPDLKMFQTRFKIWQSDDETCEGTWRNFICNFGAGDLARVTSARQMFANKFRYDLDPVTFDCMEKWYRHRALNHTNSGFDLSFYQKQPWIMNHVPSLSIA